MIKRNVKTLLIIIISYGLLFLIDYTSNYNHNYTICVFKNITGYPCPGCGLGRASLEILKGNIIRSLDYNITAIPFTIAVFTSALWLSIDLFNKNDSFFRTTSKKVSPIYLLPLYILVLTSWIINIARNI